MVGLSNEANEVCESREFEPLVAETLAYWEARAERCAGYGVEYEIDPDAENPDVRVRFVGSIEECGSERGHLAGCTPVVGQRGQFNLTHDIRIQGGFSDASTLEMVRHEFGHTVGLTHDDVPQSVMAAESVLTTPPRLTR